MKMKEIYILKRLRGDEYDGDKWETVGWTEDPCEVGIWRNGATRDEKRDYEQVRKMPPTLNS
jgi:hypothetical protein